MEPKVDSAYRQWREKVKDKQVMAQLSAMKDDEIYECFYQELAFGTGGIRGIMGAGTNRMNLYTVGRATQGLANMLLQKKPSPKAVIGYDSRHNSAEFARVCACILAANGIEAWLYPQLMPTPLVSFGVRALGCDAGIMITASHNPGKYNGYKAFGPDGCQMNLEDSQQVMSQIDALDYFDSVKSIEYDQAVKAGAIRLIEDEICEQFLDAVLEKQVRPGLLAKSGLKVVYTPLNGAGNKPVRRALALAGIENLRVVSEQEEPDGDFPTCPFPNPEIAQALERGLALCGECDADLLLATDPDCDRVGIAVKAKNGYRLMSGNEVGVLLTEYLLSGLAQQGTLPDAPVIIKTIVTTPLIYKVAAEHGAQVLDVLTGFKFIGEQIRLLEQTGRQDRYVLGFEESYGYLVGTHARDKDAVVASVLICEMAAYYKQQGLTLADQMEKLYARFGNYLSKQDNFYFEGSEGMVRMQGLMHHLQSNPPLTIAGLRVLSCSDYSTSVRTVLADGSKEALTLPKSDVLVFALENEAEVIVRPSGTEPKIKVYYTAVAPTMEQAQQLHSSLAAAMAEMLSPENE